MEDVLAAFRRDSDGAWTCMAPVDFAGPNGRIQVTPGTRLTPGTIFMGVELAAWLEAQASLTRQT